MASISMVLLSPRRMMALAKLLFNLASAAASAFCLF